MKNPTNNYVLYLTHQTDPARCNVVIFERAPVARAFLDALLGDDAWSWADVDQTPTGVPGSTIASESGVVVSTRWHPDRMREVVECAEAGGLSRDLANVAARFRLGPAADDPESGQESRRAARPAPQPRASRDGLVPIADIAAELGIEPREARAVLRGLKVEKPAAGWAFPAAEVPAVRERIRAAL